MDRFAVAVLAFLSTPSARRATRQQEQSYSRRMHFYPRPPRGGRHNDAVHTPHKNDFYPRPPRGGRRIDDAQGLDTVIISIHALREEGDRIHIVCAYITF